ncbi:MULTISPECIES: transglycosylase domain-containing protein [unclassified Streptomyces]|uniref:transglycosylase domain-containing protein n=1 Tax=unclassified Streptomyces TaxID=2593676 RepID=UPI002254EE80|nr:MULTISPECIES: transglycosylase domain-containing protein [unclassified Streptomyces]MCX4408626.1 penicillin-binding protein [Streptomyces sp. NBC_01764]MCX5185871.1 penicillin-binding protein [Streptomyces sp. NBC_00268]
MSEHRRKPSQPEGGGRAAARRGQTGPSSGRRAAPRGATGSPSDSYESGGEEERPYSGRAEARRAAQKSSSGGGRRRGADATGPGGRRGGPGGPDGPGRGRPSGPVKKRFIDYPRAGKSGAGRWMPSWKLVTGTFLTLCGGLLVAAGIGYTMVGVPNPNDTALAQNNVFYWSDGTQMAATGGQTNRQIVGPEEIPKDMKNAVVSAENATFYKDRGVDPKGIARAFVNMARGGETQGGSTITQQYVKNTYLSQDQTVSRKFKELFISIKVNSKLSKDQILAGYLNTAFYGRNAYGIQAAAQAYFGVNASKLNTEQCVFLASVLKGPNLYNPDGGVGALASQEENTKRVKDRWKWILDREVTVGNMTQAERNKITEFPMPKKATSTLSGQTGYLVDIAKEYVAKKAGITPEQLEKGGYRISTTFDKTKVTELEKAVKATKKSFLDTKARPKTDKDVQFGAASVDPKTGAIVALYGGDGFDKGHYSNNANTTGVPVGSTWKPFVLASAMEYGTVKSDWQPISPMTRYNGNDLLVIKDQNGNPIMDGNQPFRQKNEGTKAWGMVTLKKAMEQSINTPFVQLGIDTGLDNTRKVAKSVGILEDSFDKGNYRNASFSLGTSTPSAIRMADAYGTFAASGSHFEPYSVSKVLKDGKPLSQFAPPTKLKAMSEDVANNVTDVLQNVVQNGTGTKVANMGFPVAGKTGTTDKNKSAWFVGYTRELSTAVTLFRSDPKTSKLESMNGTGGVASVHGGDIPAQVWRDYMAVALKNSKHEPFPKAGKVGEILNPSPSPSPTPSTSPSLSASPTPSNSPSPSISSSPTPSPTDTCGKFSWNCGNNGGTDAGSTGDPTGTTSPTPTVTSTSGNTRGNSNGGNIFGGQNG